MRLDAPPASLPPSQRLVTYERIAAAVRVIPGVARAAVSEITPVSGMITDAYVEVEGGLPLAPPRSVTYRNVITPDWFATFGTRLVGGRDCDDRDGAPSPPVAIVNETFVRRFLPGTNAIGRRVRNGSDVAATMWLTIVGVVADANYLSLREQVPPTFGIRMALGATPASVWSMVLGRVTVSRGNRRGGRRWRQRVGVDARVGDALRCGPRDPATLMAAAGILAIVATVAASLPAWRAARTDPAEALREAYVSRYADRFSERRARSCLGASRNARWKRA